MKKSLKSKEILNNKDIKDKSDSHETFTYITHFESKGIWNYKPTDYNRRIKRYFKRDIHSEPTFGQNRESCGLWMTGILYATITLACVDLSHLNILS